MARTGKVWQKFHEAFAHADRAFAAVDEAFEAANDVSSASDPVINGMSAQPLESGYHRLRFAAKTPGERWRLFRKFVLLAFTVAIKGQVVLPFANTKPKE